MKIHNLKKRLQKDRPMTTISLRMPQDVVDDLKRIAPRLGFSGYQPLIRAYVGQGLRRDLERLEATPDLSALIDSLRRHGVQEEVIVLTHALAWSPWPWRRWSSRWRLEHGFLSGLGNKTAPQAEWHLHPDTRKTHGE